MIAPTNQVGTQTINQPQKGYSVPLTVLTSLFFMWGFLTVLNDILIPHLKKVFALNYTEAMMIQFCFFGAYFLVSIPSSIIIRRIGYKNGIITGLAIMSAACFLFYPSASVKSFPFFLGSLFLLSAGITLLQVAANPYVSILGPAETASSRLNLAQAFNSLGTFLAPQFGALFIISNVADSVGEAKSVQMPYIGIGLTLLALAAIIYFVHLPKIDHAEEDTITDDNLRTSVWQYTHLIFGALAIFMYVGAEVSIGSFLVNFMGEKAIGGISESTASKYLSFYWGGAMVGRFIGSLLLQKIPSQKILFYNALVAIVLLAITIGTSGNLAMVAVLSIGLFNSIMFPNIFTLSLQKLGVHTSEGSGILCSAIVGGAIIPLFQGKLADMYGVQLAFFLPLLCYGYIAWYAADGYKPR